MRQEKQHVGDYLGDQHQYKPEQEGVYLILTLNEWLVKEIIF